MSHPATPCHSLLASRHDRQVGPWCETGQGSACFPAPFLLKTKERRNDAFRTVRWGLAGSGAGWGGELAFTGSASLPLVGAGAAALLTGAAAVLGGRRRRGLIRH